MSEDNENKDSNKNNVITIRLGADERRMVDELKKAPYWMNISEYIRATIRHLYESKVSKEKTK